MVLVKLTLLKEHRMDVTMRFICGCMVNDYICMLVMEVTIMHFLLKCSVLAFSHGLSYGESEGEFSLTW